MTYHRAKAKKSGDSKLQDAHDAREAERTAQGPKTPRDLIDDLPNELQDSAEQHKAEGRPDRAAIAEANLEALLRTVETLNKRIQTLESKPSGNAGSVLAKNRVRMRCGTCQQDTKTSDGYGICDGTHVTLMLFPKESAFYGHFQGVKRNGVTYAGRCVVPTALADSLLADLSRWEGIERKKFITGGKIFKDQELSAVRGKALAII